MLRVIAKRTGYCDGFDNLRVDKVSVATFAASVNEARSHKVVNKLSYFWRHYVTLCSSIAKLLSILRMILARVQLLVNALHRTECATRKP